MVSHVFSALFLPASGRQFASETRYFPFAQAQTRLSSTRNFMVAISDCGALRSVPAVAAQKKKKLKHPRTGSIGRSPPKRSQQCKEEEASGSKSVESDLEETVSPEKQEAKNKGRKRTAKQTKEYEKKRIIIIAGVCSLPTRPTGRLPLASCIRSLLWLISFAPCYYFISAKSGPETERYTSFWSVSAASVVERSKSAALARWLRRRLLRDCRGLLLTYFASSISLENAELIASKRCYRTIEIEDRCCLHGRARDVARNGKKKEKRKSSAWKKSRGSTVNDFLRIAPN